MSRGSSPSNSIPDLKRGSSPSNSIPDLKRGSSPSNSIPDLKDVRQRESQHSNGSPQPKRSVCHPYNREWLCETIRPSLGTGMIVFAVPLLLPGITLTVVAFDDDSSFSRYGALHVIGMFLLSLSGLLLLVGILLNIRFHDKVHPEDMEALHVSTHEKKDHKLDRKLTLVSMDAKMEPLPPVKTPLTPEVGFLVDSGHRGTDHNKDHHVTFSKAKVGTPKSQGSYENETTGSDGEVLRSPTSILHSTFNQPLPSGETPGSRAAYDERRSVTNESKGIDSPNPIIQLSPAMQCHVKTFDYEDAYQQNTRSQSDSLPTTKNSVTNSLSSDTPTQPSDLTPVALSSPRMGHLLSELDAKLMGATVADRKRKRKKKKKKRENAAGENETVDSPENLILSDSANTSPSRTSYKNFGQLDTTTHTHSTYFSFKGRELDNLQSAALPDIALDNPTSDTLSLPKIKYGLPTSSNERSKEVDMPQTPGIDSGGSNVVRKLPKQRSRRHLGRVDSAEASFGNIRLSDALGSARDGYSIDNNAKDGDT